MNNNDTELNAITIRKAGDRVIELCKADKSFRDKIIDVKLSIVCGKPIFDLYAFYEMCNYYGLQENETMKEFLSRRIGDEDKMKELRSFLGV